MITAEDVLQNFETGIHIYGIGARNDILNAINKAMKYSSIEFAKWLSGEGYSEYDSTDRWISQETSGNKVFTTQQLYEKFLKSNK